MNLAHLSDEALHLETVALAKRERAITVEILHHLREIERRMLFAKRGSSSLVKYCMRELGYCKTGAWLRVDAMRLLKDVPEAEEKISDGSLSLTQVTQAQSFFRKEEIQDPEQKKEILGKLEGQSARESERTLLGLSAAPETHFRERARPVSARLTELRLYVDEETMREIDELKALLSHAHPGMEIKDVLKYGLKLALGKHRVKKPSRSASIG